MLKDALHMATGGEAAEVFGGRSGMKLNNDINGFRGAGEIGRDFVFRKARDGDDDSKDSEGQIPGRWPEGQGLSNGARAGTSGQPGGRYGSKVEL